MKRILLALGMAALGTVGVLLAGWWLWPRPPVESADRAEETATRPSPGLPWFDDVTSAAGIDFSYFDPATPNHSIEETMCGGLAWIDYDNDGWPDLLCVQSGPAVPEKYGKPLPTHRLYRNLGNGTFRDVTEVVGLKLSGFGMGVAVGDFDNDGYDDLAITYLDRVQLLHNQPDGQGGRRFVDVTAKAGLNNPHWGTSCGWGDIDGDGFLDLYVCNYVVLDPRKPLICHDPRSGEVQSCSPSAYPHTHHVLYRNNGDGTFTDISRAAGISTVPPAPGLGVVLVDLDGDGQLDLYVANDMRPAYLFHNQGGGKFVEKAVFHGCAYGYNGGPMAGMGVLAGDLDGSGRPSLFVTNFQNEPNILFLNRGNLQFDEQSYPSGLAMPSLPRLGFGTVLFDANLDGRPDLAVTNGHVYRNVEKLAAAPFAQEPLLFVGDGKGKFQDVSATGGPHFRRRLVGRGLTVVDYDNDGRPDLAFGHSGGPLVLLRNATVTDHHWLRLELIGDGKKSNRNAIGARVEVQYAGGRQTHWVCGGSSYLSAGDRRLLLGLGTATRAERVHVRWPSGRQQTFTDLAADRWYRLREGRADAEVVQLRPAGVTDPR